MLPKGLLIAEKCLMRFKTSNNNITQRNKLCSPNKNVYMVIQTFDDAQKYGIVNGMMKFL